MFSGLIIWIVGKLGWGIQVSGFGPAYVTALVIAVLNVVIAWLLGVLGITIGAGFLGTVINFIIAALVLMVAGNYVKGLVVKGFTGALVAALAIAAVGWLITLALGSLI